MTNIEDVEILKDAKKRNALFKKFEAILFTRMYGIYSVKAKRAIERASKIASDGGSEKEVISSVNKELKKPFSEKDFKKMDQDIARYYVQDKSLTMAQFKLEPKKLRGVKLEKAVTPELGPGFDLDDKEFLEGIQRQNAIAAGSFYSRSLSAHVVDAIQKTMNTKGLTRAQLGDALRIQLEKSLGLKPNQTGDIVSPGFKGTAEQYFSGLATTSINRSQNFNNIVLYTQAEIEQYQISAIIDRRTSQICLSMDGRTFTVEQARNTIKRVIEAEDAESLANDSPWRRNLEEFGIKNPREKVESSKVSRSLADAGMALPPYHFRCRTQVIPI